MEVRSVFAEAEDRREALHDIGLGLPRTFAVCEAVLWSEFGGVSFAAQVATVVSREARSTNLTSKIASIFKEAKDIRFGDSTSISISNFLKSPVLGPRPRLVRKGTAAAVAETAAAALVEHESARRVNLEMAAAAYDEALELDPLAEGRAKGAAAGDPLREGMIAHNMLDQAAIQQQQLAEVLEARAEEKKALAEALARVRELELSAASVAALGLSTAAAGGGELLDLEDLDLAGEDLEGGDLAGEDLAGEDLVELLAGKDVPEDLPEDEPEAVPEGPVFERGESVRIVRGHFPGATPASPAAACWRPCRASAW